MSVVVLPYILHVFYDQIKTGCIFYVLYLHLFFTLLSKYLNRNSPLIITEYYFYLIVFSICAGIF